MTLLRNMAVGTLSAAALLATSLGAAAEWKSSCSGARCDGGLRATEQPVYDGAWTTRTLPVGHNTEQPKPGRDPYHWGFAISVDGERFAGDDTAEDYERRIDIELSKVDIQVKFDGLGVKPILNVSTVDLRHSYQAGEKVTFLPTSNYPAWIARAEIRIYEAGHHVDGLPVALVEVPGPGQEVSWIMPPDGEEKFFYVLRVYDGHGRYDQTIPLGLRRTAKNFKRHATAPTEDAVAAGNLEDRTATRNIPVYGGAITVFGQDVPVGFRVKAIGERVPVDPNGKFLIQRILPPGEHDIDVRVWGNHDGDIKLVRPVHIPENEWFYVGLADLTVGKRLGSKQLVAAAPGDYKSTYTKGRVAFYLKGKIKGRYILTAAADTGEDKAQHIFRNFDGKGAQDILDRIDPDKYYPVYGDDSTSIEDAPTDGKFFVRLERGQSHIMWGRFRTTIRGTEFARSQRKLYGAHARYQSETVTNHGKPVATVEAYASQPDTLPQRDNFRGTGGSLYFLSRQDVNRNSETLFVEVRDRVSNLVLRRTPLRYGEDYDINYVQGVIILKNPLASTTGSDTIITDGGLGGDHQYLLVQYEYTPPVGEVDGYSAGGRAEAWLMDRVRVGITAANEETGTADQKVYAGDVRVRLAPNSYIEAEVARSKGPGFSSTNSINGGLSIDPIGTAGRPSVEAYAYRTKAHVDLEDMNTGLKGHIGAYYEWRDDGFSSFTINTAERKQAFGLHAQVDARDDLRYLARYKDFREHKGRRKQVGDAEVEYDFREDWAIGFGLKHTLLKETVAGAKDGGRTDAGVRLSYKPDENHIYYVFGQTTLATTGDLERNDRGGVGAHFRVTEKIGVEGEVSYGSLGWGGRAAVTYDPTADDRYYFGYKLDPERSINTTHTLGGADGGVFVLGAKQKYSDYLSAYGENNYDIFGNRRSLTNTYGVIYTPSALWSIGGGIEYGDVKDHYSTAELERIALSGTVAYKVEDKISWRLKGEARFEDSPDGSKDRNTYFLTAGTSIRHDENWRFLAKFDGVISETDQAAFLDANYLKASVGYAYRGTDWDGVNGLFKYTALYDLPGPDQITSAGTPGPAQRSHVVSADVNIDVTQHVTAGAKYGVRFGEVSATRNDDDFIKSTAHLAVLRADIHVVKNWDALLEARVLHTPEIETTKVGFLAGVYRHLGNNLKVGVGYNFGSFSDDVADLTHDEGGVFVNVVGKF